MSTNLVPDAIDRELYQAAARATLSASIHNTQPWRFVVRDGKLDLYSDPERRVPMIDPTGRELALSCGAALFGARIALAAAQIDTNVRLLPDAAVPDLLATIEVVGAIDAIDAEACRLNLAAESRHSNRRRFSSGPVPAELIDRLIRAAELEGAWMRPIRDLDDEIAVATLSQRADSIQNADPGYRAELRVWTTDDPDRLDGVPSAAIPHVTGGARDDVPVRDFDTNGAGELPTETRSSVSQSMVVLGTESDALADWLVAGQALARVLLELTSCGYVASLFSQVIEVPATRIQLRRELRISGQPQMLLRVGLAEPTPRTPRRLLSEAIATRPQVAPPDDLDAPQ